MEIEIVEIGKLHCDPANARKHSDKNLQAIAASLNKFGQQKPLVIDRSNTVLAGNGTLEAARSLGFTHIKCVRTKLDGSDAKAYAIADNRSAELAEWNDDILAAHLETLQSDGLLDAAGFTDEELAKLLQDVGVDLEEPLEDTEPEPPENPITKIGDLWILGQHRLLCGDSTKACDVTKLMNGEKADLCFTSPPYADMRKYSGNDLSIEVLSSIFQTFQATTEVFCINLGLQFKDDAIYPYWDEWTKAANQNGLKMLAWLVWDRINATSVSSQTKMFALTHEWIFVYGKKSFDLNRTWEKSESSKSRELYYKTNEAGQKVTTRRQKNGTVKESVIGETFDKKNMGTVFTCFAEMRRDLNHPARFPVEFPRAYIESMTHENGSVVEPFCGSGTTLIAAEQLGRKCYGMEIAPEYCDVIVKRWETLTGEKGILENVNS